MESNISSNIVVKELAKDVVENCGDFCLKWAHNLEYLAKITTTPSKLIM